MQQLPQDELRDALRIGRGEGGIDSQTAMRLKRDMADEFRKQLTVGVPTNEDEAGLRRLAAQLRRRQVRVKLYLRHALHAKLYLFFRTDHFTPTVGYLGSSNLTFAGLSKQGELNVDVVDSDACKKLTQWFNDRWNDRFCIDISDELAEIIEQSWAASDVPPPYQIYINMAYHLSREARAGLSEFRIPRDFGNKLFEFQKAAVKIAAHHLNKRGGVIIGDVVGLGKTLMATALARIFEDDHGIETLIICPKNLVPMWEDHRTQYGLRGRVLSITQAPNTLADLRRYRLVLVDESHNLRNPDGKRYRALMDYIQTNDSKVIMLSATPYNKTFLDLSNQLRLFVPEEEDIGIRPECLLRQIGEVEFIRRHQCAVRSLKAFEKSAHADDWRELMRLYLVRRTRSFIKENYAKTDPANGRKYLEFEDGGRSYFPDRVPRTAKFSVDEHNPKDQYAALFAPKVVEAVNDLILPRYGLGNYQVPMSSNPPTRADADILKDLSRAGNRLMGFCRTNLFKRLESSGFAFMLSVDRHILRNFIFLHALDKGLALPIGTQDVGLLDSNVNDADTDLYESDDDDADAGEPDMPTSGPRTKREYQRRAVEIYQTYATKYKRRFKWLRAAHFEPRLSKDLSHDAESLMRILDDCGQWEPSRDEKLKSLIDLIAVKHPTEKVLVFTQFADTVDYLADQLARANIGACVGVTGQSADPTKIAWQFSPVSNSKRNVISTAQEHRVVIATDVLSEGQNLQDCSIIVNYDLPWAIIRLIQRAGRVDRIGQNSDKILCYSFLPAEGVERIIDLRGRVRKRLRENSQVVGTDEAFFDDDDKDDTPLINLYNEKAGILEANDDTEVDLASYAYQIWKNAIDADPKLESTIMALPNVASSTKPHQPTAQQPEGALVYMRTRDGNDALAWMDKEGKSVTESQLAILKAAECAPDTPRAERHANHHELVAKGVGLMVEEEKSVGGQLGRPSGARFRTYERLKRHAEQIKDQLWGQSEAGAQLCRAIEEIYKYPLLQSAIDSLNRQLRCGVNDHDLASVVIGLRSDNRLCRITEEQESDEAQIICSMGLRKPG